MAEKNIEKIYESNLLWSEPIEYKGITLYPVKCADIQIFYSSVQSLLYDPLRYNSTISTLPRLYFITDIINHQNDVNYCSQNILLFHLYIQFQFLLKLVLGENQTFAFIPHNGKNILQIRKQIVEENEIKENVINVKAKDFDFIREIILHQNGVDYDDTFIHEDVRNWILEQESAEKSNSPTVEDYMEAFMLESGSYNIEDFKQVPIRRFNRIVEKIVYRENYNIQMTASMSGFVSFKGKIDHWMAVNKKNSIYDKYFKEVK
jgi:hypothetical protein